MGKQSREKKERKLESLNQQAGPRRVIFKSSEKIYFSIIEWGTYLILFTPLVFIKSYFFPFVVPKTIFFRIIVDILLIFYVLLVMSNRKYLPRFNALTITITIFLGITILTSFTGVNFLRSFWSTFERMTGLLTFFHLYAFFIILTNVFRERKYWERILTVSILVGTLLGLYTLTTTEASTRSGGTVGNVSFLATYLLFDIFFALILFLAKSGGWKIFYGTTLLIMSSVLFFSQELPLGGIGAFFMGIFLLLLGYMVFSKQVLLKRLAPVVLVLGTLAVIGIFQTSFFKEKFFDVKTFPGEARRMVWQMGWEGWKEKFWLGWGQENFNIPFAKYFDSGLPLTFDVWYDRAHNIVLDTGVSSGAVGLVSYLAIFGVAIFGLLRVSAKVAKIKNVFLPLGMAVLLMIYFVQNIFVFDMISSYMIFFLSLAFIDFLISFRKEEIQPSYSEKKNYFHPFFGALLIIVSLSTLYFGNIQPARASRYTVQGLVSPLEEAIPSFQKAIEISPMSIFETPEQFSKKVSDYIFAANQNKEVLKNGFELATEELKKSIAQSPTDYRLYLVLGRNYNDFFLLTQDQEKLKTAEIYLNKAIELSPNNQQTYWSLAQTRLSQQRPEESFNLLQKAIDLEPRYAQSHWYLAMAYKIAGKNKEALEKVKDAEEAGFDWKASLNGLGKVIEIYQSLQNDKELVELYPLAIKFDPQNAQFYAAWAVSSANLGDFPKARELVTKALELKPDFAAQLEEFLKSLPQ